MVTAADMRRGAREANEESHRAAMSRDMGKALGEMTAFIFAINRLSEAIERLEGRVAALEKQRATPAPKDA